MKRVDAYFLTILSILFYVGLLVYLINLGEANCPNYTVSDLIKLSDANTYPSTCGYLAMAAIFGVFGFVGLVVSQIATWSSVK